MQYKKKALQSNKRGTLGNKKQFGGTYWTKYIHSTDSEYTS
jgi:hypothetical protein